MRIDAGEDADTTIAYQGKPGANSHVACLQVHPDMVSLPCPTFEDAFAAVRQGQARLGMIPIENSVAGRVADIHTLLPTAGLHIVGEYFHRVRHHLMAPKGMRLADITAVHSHIQALGQCRRFIRSHGWIPRDRGDTAGAAEELSREPELGAAAIASELAAEIYGLDILAHDIEDADHNTTRFVIVAREPEWPAIGSGPCITTFEFRVRNVPAALYKALGGFATNGINMLKLESYQDGAFVQAQFYTDVLGHPDDPALAEAMRELRFFSDSFQNLGVYPASPARDKLGTPR